MNIEDNALEYLLLSLHNSDYLHADLKNNDKTPSWDGSIFVYDNPYQNKKNLEKIDVQVKGHKSNDECKKEISYPVEVKDLENYFNYGGAIYFVVHVRALFDYTIYYKCLYAFDLKNIIRDAKKQNTKNIKMGVFPQSNPDEILEIMINFIKDRKRQYVCISNDNPGLESFQSFEFSYTFSNSDKLSNVRKLPYKEIFLYGNLHGLKYPVKKMEGIVTKQSTETEYKYKDEFRKIRVEFVHKKNIEIVNIGNAITLKSDASGNHWSIDVKAYTGLLSDTINDYEYLVEVLRIKSLLIHGFCEGRLSFENLTDDYQKNVSDKLEYLYKIRETLGYFGVSIDLDLKCMNSQEEIYLQNLIRSIVDKKSISFKNDINIPSFLIVKISNICVAVSVEKNDESTYLFQNFFERGIPIRIVDKETENEVLASHFVILRRDNFTELNNINYDILYDSLTSTPPSDLYYDQVNLLLLEMLHAFDANEDNAVLILYAEKIAVWLFNNAHNIPINYRILNMLQTMKRYRLLSDDEVKMLDGIIKDAPEDLKSQIGAYLLYGKNEEAHKILNSISENDREEFSKFPIYKFMSKLSC